MWLNDRAVKWLNDRAGKRGGCCGDRAVLGAEGGKPPVGAVSIVKEVVYYWVR